MHHDDKQVHPSHDDPSRESPHKPSDNKERALDGPIGAGAEAAEGIHTVGMDGAHQRSGLEHRTTGRSSREGAERSGSEPLRERTWVHESGYGGKDGKPRTSSDERERSEQDASVSPPLGETPLTPTPEGKGFS